MAWRILLSASSRRIWDDLRLGIPPVSSWLGKSSDGSWFLRIFIRCTPSLKEPETPETNSFFKRLPTSYITCVKHKEYKYLALRALLTIYLSICLSIYLSAYLSIHLSIYLSIYLSLSKSKSHETNGFLQCLTLWDSQWYKRRCDDRVHWYDVCGTVVRCHGACVVRWYGAMVRWYSAIVRWYGAMVRRCRAMHQCTPVHPLHCTKKIAAKTFLFYQNLRFCWL